MKRRQTTVPTISEDERTILGRLLADSRPALDKLLAEVAAADAIVFNSLPDIVLDPSPVQETRLNTRRRAMWQQGIEVSYRAPTETHEDTP